MKLLLKQLVCVVAALAWALSAQAGQPIMVGHRGCIVGVENTAAAYRIGVDLMGYAGLECDVRVTADGHYVICHDTDTKRLGGNLEVADATLEQLLAETLKQKRDGATYTGRLCTVEEYLDICVEKNVFPIVELKWATGINNNDMSKFDGLAQLIKERGLTQRVIFLTSMKKSLEYIRTNYPEFPTLQWLCRDGWRDNVEWCVQWQFHPSIEGTCIDDTTVPTFHERGLHVACWTIDNPTLLRSLVAKGVDYVTTNKLTEF